MKTAVVIMLATLALLGSGFTGKRVWVIDSRSQVIIHGTTNVNTFSCKTSTHRGSDTLQFINSQNSVAKFRRNRMAIPVAEFDCGGRQISRDFRETLKHESYPEVEIYFKSVANTSFENNSRVKGIVEISLAGCTVEYPMCYLVKRNETETQLIGSQAVAFSDFNLEAPEKLKGLIKVKDHLQVEFKLVLKEISPR